MPAELSGPLDLEEVLARLPHLTVHLVDLPDRHWVADPATLTCWVRKDTEPAQRERWAREASAAIAEARPDLGAGSTPSPVPRLRSVPR